MRIKDNVYGEFVVNDKVLIELLKKPLLLRLKNISQFGVPDEYFHRKNYSRYEHSIGVMLLLKKLGATLEEQVAGLLHDISNPAFSHVIDWVFADGGSKNSVENYHNTIHKEFIYKSDIPRLLEKHGFDCERILNEENFGLLERVSPDLCADRFDYAIRQLQYFFNPGEVKRCLNGIINYNGEMVFKDKASAYAFASNFLGLQTQFWGEYEAVIRYHIFSDILKYSLGKKVLDKDDFFKEEPQIISKLKKFKDPYVQEKLLLLKNKSLSSLKKKKGKRIYKKFRFTDPKVLSKGSLIRLSELDLSYAKLLQKHRNVNEKGIIIAS